MTNIDDESAVPVHATLLVAPGCSHCIQVKQVLKELLEKGQIAKFDLVDISTDVDRAEKLGVRSVPWLQLNAIELQGAHSRDEIIYWVKQATLKEGRQALFDSLLEVGQLSQVESMLRRTPGALTDLLVLFSDQQRQINVRIGASAVLESLRGSGLLEQAINEIGMYTQHEEVSTRIDACHVLSFTQHPKARKFLIQAMEDANAEVREVAQESMDALSQNG